MADTPRSIGSAPALAFSFATQQLRVVMRDGEPWFVAADVLTALTLDRKAMERLDGDEKGVSSIHTPGGEQQMTVVNESGLYSLILGSRKPEAKRFKKWVTSEVLPSIRKTGRYQAPATTTPQPQAVEQLTAQDTARITRLVWAIGQWFGLSTAWRQALWIAIRRATGVPAPQRFTVAHLPAIAAELRRCWAMAERLRHAQVEAETLVIRRILRHNEPAEPLLAQARSLMLEAAQAERQHFSGVLDHWNERDLARLTAREPLQGWCSSWDAWGEPEPPQIRVG